MAAAAPPSPPDISSGELLAAAARSLPSCTLETVATCWKEVSKCIGEALTCGGRGIRVEGLGTFTLDTCGKPIFLMASEFGTRHALRESLDPSASARTLASTTTNSKLNIARVAMAAGLDRGTADAIITAVLGLLNRHLKDRRTVELSFHPVADLRVVPRDAATLRFAPEFAARAEALRRRAAAPPAAAGAAAAAAVAEHDGRHAFKPTPRAVALQRQVLAMKAARAVHDAGVAAGARRRSGGGGGDDNLGGTTSGARRPAAAAQQRRVSAGGGSGARGGGLRQADLAALERRHSGGGAGAAATDFSLPRQARTTSKASRGASTVDAQRRGVRPPPSYASSDAPTYHTPRPSEYGGGGGNSGGKSGGGGRPLSALERRDGGARAAAVSALLRNDNRTGGGGRDRPARGSGGGSGCGGGGGGGGGGAERAAEEVVAAVRARLIARGGGDGIHTLSRLLRIMDDDGDGRLDRAELRRGLRDCGVALSGGELERVFAHFDADRNGFVSFDELLAGLRGPLSARRAALIRQAFASLDEAGVGSVGVEELRARYSCAAHPEVVSGAKSEAQVLAAFLAQWDTRDRDGRVSAGEFEDYYKSVSASVDDDDYFELMMRNAWRMAGGEGWCANSANKRVLVHGANGEQRIAELHGLAGQHSRDVKDVHARLRKQGGDAGVRSDDAIEFAGYVDARGQARRPGGPPPPPAHHGSRANHQQQQQQQHAPIDDAPPPPPRGYGDQCAPPPPPSPPQSSGKQQGRGGGGGGGGGEADPWQLLREILYTPPCTLEGLIGALQANKMSEAPSAPAAAVAQRLATLRPALGRRGAAALAAAAAGGAHAATVDITALHATLSSRFGHARGDAAGGGGGGGGAAGDGGGACMERVRRKLLDRGGAGLRGLARALAVMDNDGDRKLTKEELKWGLQDAGVPLTLAELDGVFTYLDRDRSGALSLEELARGVRPPMAPRRAALVAAAYARLDAAGDGRVTVDDLAAAYDASWHPRVRAGAATARDALRELLAQWDGNADGEVSAAEFQDYYETLSSLVDGDDYFELMMRNAWRMEGGEGWCANSANNRVLVHGANGEQRIAELHGLAGQHSRDVKDVHARLRKQGGGAGVRSDDAIEFVGYVDARGQARRPGGPPPPPQRHHHQQQQQRGVGSRGGGGGGGSAAIGGVQRFGGGGAAAAAAPAPPPPPPPPPARRRSSAAADAKITGTGGVAAMLQRATAEDDAAAAARAAEQRGNAVAERHGAAERLQAHFRGFRGRQDVEGRKRREAAAAAAAAEEAAEEERSRARLARTKMRGTYGF